MTQAVHNHQAVPRGDPQSRPGEKSEFEYDIWLIGAALTLLCIGLIMVVSTSVSIAERREFSPLYYFWRQLGAAVIGCVTAFAAMRIPLEKLDRYSTPLLFLCCSSPY